MKRLTAILLTLVLLTGCAGPAAGETEENTRQTQTAVTAEKSQETAAPAEPGEASFDLWEENAVDDSMTFQWTWKQGEKELYRYFMEDIFPQYLDTWFEDGELLESGTSAAIYDGVYGRVLIGGTPKQDMGWNSLERDGKTVYCRRIQVTHVPHSKDYVLEKTQPSPDLKQPQELIPFNIEYMSIDESGLQLPEIRSAEFYVKSLGQCFLLKDPEKLAILHKALTLPPQTREFTFQGQLMPEGEGDPLVLDLEGQGQRMVLVEPGGGPGTDIWGGHILLMPMSIYELFGVSAQAEAYGRDPEGRTELTVRRPMPDSDLARVFRAVLDDRGNLLEFEDQTQWEELGAEEWKPGGEPEERISTFTYDDQDRILTYHWGAGDRELLREFIYEGDLLQEMVTTHGQDYRERYTYEYDDRDRLIAKIARSESGEEIVPNSSFYWFDDQGQPHFFWYHENGEPGGDAPETPVRRPKK